MSWLPLPLPTSPLDALTLVVERVVRSVITAAAIGVALLVGACTETSDGPPAESNTPDPITLTMWTWENGGHDLLIRAFERNNPGIRVELQYSGFDQHHTALRSALDAGMDVPDLAAIERDYLPSFAARPADFFDLRSAGAGPLADVYLPWRWADGVVDTGAVIGLPTDVGGLAFAYRRDLFEAAGLPTEPDEVSALFADWDGFFDAGRTFRDADTGAAFLDSPDSVFFTSLGQQSLGFYTASGESFISENEQLKQSFDRAVAALDESLVTLHRQFGPEWDQAMVDDGFAVLSAPSWMRSYMADTAPGTSGLWRLVPVPGVAGNWGGSQLVVPADSDHTSEAAELIRFLTDEEAQLRLFDQNGNFPSTPSLYERQDIAGLRDQFFGDQTVGQLYIDSLSGLSGQPSGELDREYRDIVTTVFGDVMAATLDSDAAWEEFVSRATAVD